MNSSLQRIQRTRPFAHPFGIARVEPVAGDAAHSGTAFFAEGEGGRRFKLRDCGNPLRAARLAHWVHLLEDVVPALVAREGRYLLLEALSDFRPMTRVELILGADKVGRIGARAHAASGPTSRSDRVERALLSAWIRQRFRREVSLLASRNVIPRASATGARQKFDAYHACYGLPLALELDDIHKGNWMLREADGAMRYVDEEGVGLRPKGMGLASLLKTATRLHTWRLYKRGYAEVADASFISMPYTEYLLLIDTVRRVAHKVRTEARPEKLPTEVGHLRAMSDTPDLSLAWRFPKGDS